MDRETSLGWIVLPAAGLAGAIALVAAPASGDTAASAAASAAEAPTASASASAKPPEPPVVRGADIPTERSPVPKPKEWNDAKLVSPSRKGSPCKLKLLREYLRAECTDDYGAGLIAGSPKDVHIWASGDLFGWDDVRQETTHSTVIIDLPVERGQSRIVQIVSVDSFGDWGGLLPSDGFALHVDWRAGAADPTVVFTFPQRTSF